jgi:hypothetical protein
MNQEYQAIKNPKNGKMAELLEAVAILEKKGWRQVTKAAPCAGCGKDFEWWRTPRRKLIPLTASNLDYHWPKCRRAFQNKRPPTYSVGYFKWPYGYR